MKIAVFSAQSYDHEFLEPAAQELGLELQFFEAHLERGTVRLAEGFDAVCVFVNDDLSSDVVHELAEFGVRIVALRCAGFNNVDIEAAEAAGLTVVRVPKYSPHAVAEHTFGLILALNRKIHRAYNRVRDNNFSIAGLLGFDMHGKTIGVVGTGEIGRCVVEIANGFGCRVLMSDVQENDKLTGKGTYCDLDQLLTESDIITLHCPLNDETKHLIDEESLAAMKNDVVLVNTSRGGLVDTQAVIQALKSKQIGALALDVYEEEADLFFEDRSASVIQDDVFARLLTFPNVLISSHQAFFTNEALSEIARVTMHSLNCFATETPLPQDVLVIRA